MVRPKLSFDKKEDKVTAIADFIRQNVSSISFVGMMKDKDIMSAKADLGTIEITETDYSLWNISGHISLKYEIDDNGGTLDCWFSFTSSCSIKRGEDNIPIVSDLDMINVTQKI